MKINPRMTLRIAVIVVALAVFAWKWWGGHHPGPDTTAAAPVESAHSTAKPARPLPPATLKLGGLALKACELKRPETTATTAAFCARLPVAENRTASGGREIDLRLAVVKSDSQVADKDLVAYLAGGPGQSAIETYPEIASALAPLKKHHDILLLDQRGTGGSHPLACPETEKAMKQVTERSFDPQRAKALTARCLAEVERKADPRFYTTTDAVADLEAVRRALGAPQLDLVGISYGTRLAQQYARRYPKAVRSIVLDGVVPNQVVLVEDFAQALQRSLKLQASACNAAPACRKAFGDWYATLRALHDKLQAQPATSVTFNDPATFRPVTRNVSADTLAGVVRFFSYSATTAALLPLAVDQAAKGNYAPLLGQSQILSGDLSGSMNGGMQLSVACGEDAGLLRPRPQDADTILGSQLIDAIEAMCSVWPHGAMPGDFHAPFQSSIPTLLLSGERDPVTPPDYAAEVLKGLSDGRSLVVKGLGHGEAIGAGCMPKLVEQFVVDLKPKQLDTKCLDRVGPIPAFVNFNGPSP
jgi:pimeloyl-ACP methyl ester carboxylesterase